jgi:hypothetical protein
MPNDESSDPGDVAGIDVLVPGPNGAEENEDMAMDLPENVATLIVTESAGNVQANNRDGRNIGTIAMGVLEAAMARNFDELGTVESRSNSGVMATPIAGPTTQV